MNDPLILVEDLGLSTANGPVFAGLTFVVPREALSVVVGPSGSGRSALLLAVSGRMRDLTGSVRLAPDTRRTRPRDLRAQTAVARLATLVEPEGQLTVAESMTERALIEGVQVADAEAATAEAEALFEVSFDRGLLVDQLPAYQQALLCVALAMVRPAALIVLDDADRALDLLDQRRLMAALVRLGRSGRAVLASTTERAAVPDEAQLIDLTATPAPAPGAGGATSPVTPPDEENC